MSEKIITAIDIAVKEGDETAVVIGRQEKAGVFEVLATLHGEAAEYVAKLEARIKALEANTSKSVLRRLDAQLAEKHGGPPMTMREVMEAEEVDDEI